MESSGEGASSSRPKLNDSMEKPQMMAEIDVQEWAVTNPNTPAPEANRYRIRISDEEGLDERILIHDPKPIGRQILEAAGRLPADEHMLLLVQTDGMLEEINVNEPVDLRRPGVERFLVFRSDRIFYFEIDGRRFPWAVASIREASLRKLARVPDNYNIWLERRAEEDLLVLRGSSVDLSPAALERFYTGVDQTQAGSSDLGLPVADRRYLEEHGIAAELIAEGSQSGIVLRGYSLSESVTPEVSDLLILLPAGYPDASPDMFYTDPWVRVKASGGYPQAADQPFSFAGRNWQRWSRHNTSWRPGIDGIWTHLRRITSAIKDAK
jgi:hypothetical protein